MKNEFIVFILYEIWMFLIGIKGWSEMLKIVDYLIEEEIK